MARKGFGLTGAGHIAQVAGFYRTGHLLRASSLLSGAGGGGEGIAAIGVAAGGVAIALGGLLVATKALELGFNTLIKSATELVGAISQIGGARGLQEMLVESVTAEKAAILARQSVMPENRLSQAELMAIARAVSENPLTGAPTTLETLQGMRKIGTITGNLPSQDIMEFLGKFALVSGTNIMDTSEIYGRLSAQHPDLSPEMLKNSMLAARDIGLKGSFNAAEMEQAVKLMQVTTMIGGMTTEEKIRDVITMGTLAKPGMGTLEQAGVGLQAFLKEGKRAGMFRMDAAGNVTNLDEALLKVIGERADLVPHQLMAEQRSARFVSSMRSRVSDLAGVSETDFSNEANEKRKQVIIDFERNHDALEQFKKDVEEAITPQERFRSAFNKIADNLEAEFLPIMEKMAPVVDGFAKSILSHKDDIAKWFDNLATKILPQFVEAVPSVIAIIKDLGTAIGSVIQYVMELLGNPTNVEDARSEFENDKRKVEQARKDYEKNVLDPNVPEITKEYLKRNLESAKRDLKNAQLNLDLQQHIDLVNNPPKPGDEVGYRGVARPSDIITGHTVASNELLGSHKELVRATQQSNSLLDLVHKGITYNPLVPPSRAEIGL